MVPGEAQKIGMANSSITSSRSRADVLILRPPRGLMALNLRDLWVYRELVYFLTWRDLKVRYKQTVLGALWAVLQPLLQMIVFTLLFNQVGKIDSGDVPYPIFSFTALLPWGLFTKALTDAGRSLVNNRNMITKIYFPRLIIPFATILSGLVDFAIAFVVLVGMMIYYNVAPGSGYHVSLTPNIWLLPLFLLLALVTALGVGLWLSALNVIYRDVGYVIPFLTQFWLFITPVAYPVSVVTGKWRLVYAINPMVGVVEGFRWSLLGMPMTSVSVLWISILVSVVVLVSGLFYFRYMERSFADEI